MKVGMRKPSIKRSIKARTTGRVKRTVKRTVNPFYGKKGMGFINNPKKAIYNKVYRKTTFSVRDVFKGSKKGNIGSILGFLAAVILLGFLPIAGAVLLFAWIVKMILKLIRYYRQKNKMDDYCPDVVNEDLQEQMPEISSKYETMPGADLKFDDFIGNAYLKYCYYDVAVKGTQYQNIDYSKIKANDYISLVDEPSNEYDPDAIKVSYGEICLGYIPKNNLQKMIHDFVGNESKSVTGFIKSISAENNEIIIALGFYVEMSPEELRLIEHYDTNLTGTTKKDDNGVSRQENLANAYEGDEVFLEYNYETEKYLVTDTYGNELGEISKTISEKISKKTVII